MPIPNVSTLYQRIAKGSEGGHEFARFIKLLLHADYSAKGIDFISESDASGDYRKVDAYIPGDKDFEELITGFQFKFFPANVSVNQKNDIIDSLENALKQNTFIKEYILITPEDWLKEQQGWFNALKKKYEKPFVAESEGSTVYTTFKLSHWGHTKIIELALKHDHIGQHYFPELYPVGIGKFKLAEAYIDCKNSDWLPFSDSKDSYHQSYPNSRSHLTSDPVFDFHFTNSSPETFLLQTIEIHIEKITTQLKGIPVSHFLMPIGTMQYKMDFKKPINVIDMDDLYNGPMVFKATEPMRFKLQLLEFTKNCPGNCATIKFWFHFSNYSIPTESFYLSF